MRISDWSSDVCSSDLPGIESIDAARDWNQRLPDAQVEMIHDRGEWSIFPTWSMPKFHIVCDGKVIETVKGRPRSQASTRQPLLDALRRAGLMEQAPAEPASPEERRHPRTSSVRKRVEEGGRRVVRDVFGGCG